MPNTETISLSHVHRLVREKTEALGGATAAAKEWGCTMAMVSMVNREVRNPTDAMLAAVGVEKVEISYRRKV